MDPVTGFAVASAGSAIMGGLSGRAQGMSDAARQESEARLADTQALQRDTIARGDLDAFLSTMRSSRAANGLSATSPNARVLEAEAIMQGNKGRLIERADSRQQAANLRAGAKASRSAGNWSLATGLVKAAIPISQYGMNRGWGS